MNLRELASLIPAIYRKEILEMNMINTATANASDPKMHYLFTIWKTNIEEDLKEDCGLCLQKVLRHYKALQGTLIELEKESSLLNTL
jgi:molybdopterin-guanine dinucleotide biosynthesis protein A